MLVYLAAGERDFEKHKLKPFSRAYWEIFAVAEGRIRLCRPGHVGALRSQTLWVFPPGMTHSWRGDNHRSAQVVVFHFDELPDPIGEWVLDKGWLELPVDSGVLQKIQSHHDRTVQEWRAPGIFASLKWQQLAVELALLIGALVHPPQTRSNSNQPGMRVQQAMRLFAKRLRDGWKVDDICRELSISPAHLRRLFRQVLQRSPHSVFEEIRLNRSKELMMVPDSKLENVAVECGYESGTILSKAFKRRHHMSPTEWRSGDPSL